MGIRRSDDDVAFVIFELARAADLTVAVPACAAISVDADHDHIGLLEKAVLDVRKQFPETIDRAAIAAHWAEFAFGKLDSCLIGEAPKKRWDELPMRLVLQHV